MKIFKLIGKYILAVAMLSTLFLIPPSSAEASGREIVVNNLAGGRSYRLFVPSGYTPGDELPLVVMLHGCTQTSAEFRDGTQMNLLAEQENFIVLYPEQSTSANSSRCWNWFEPAHQRRGSGEPQIIVDMIRRVQSEFSINHDAVFVSGLSAGGGMSVNLGVLYPDVFAAIAPFAGLAYQSGNSMITAFSAMSPGNTAVAPATAARNASNQVPANGRSIVPALVFTGLSDFTVVPRASENIVTQMLEYNRLHGATIGAPSTRSGSANGLNYSVQTFRNPDGDRMIEFYQINGLGHAWSGGNGRIAHTNDRGPNASLIAWNFFQEAAGIESNGNQGGSGNGNETEPGDGNETSPGNGNDAGILTSSASILDHFNAGRINLSEYLDLGGRYGFTTVITLYSTDGNVWTTVRPETPGNGNETEPGDGNDTEVQSISASIVDHFNAGRISLSEYLDLGGRLGFTTIITLYNIDGTWTKR